MARSKVGVDDPENLNRLLSHVCGGSNTSSGATVLSPPTPPELVPEQRHGTMFTNGAAANGAATNGAATNGAIVDRTKPIDVPLRRSSHDTTSNRNSPTSPDPHPVTSPHFSGLRPPQNTPKTRPASPHIGPARTYDDELADVSLVVSTIVGTMDTKPLFDSIWAPKSNGYHRSALSRYSTPSRDLTPTRVVEANPAINDSFTRMSFKVADPDDDLGKPLIGEHLVRSPSSKAAHKQGRGLSFTSQKVEAELDPISDRGSVRAPPSGTDEDSGLADDVKKTRFEASLSLESTPQSKEPTSTDWSEKDSTTTSSVNKPSLPPHMRITSHSPQSALKSIAARSKGLENKTLFTVTLPESDPASSLKKASSSVGTHQATTPSSPQVSTNTTGIKLESNIAAAPRAEDELVAALQKLKSTESLKPEECVLLAELASRVLRRSSSTELSETSEPTDKPTDRRTGKAIDKTSEMDLPNTFLDKWASKPKNTKENTAATANVVEATSIATAKPSASAAPSEPTKTLAQRPPLVAKATNITAKSVEDLEDREHKTFFNAWPQLEQRDRAAAQVRTVVIKGLPTGATPSFITSLVYGGPLEWINMRESLTTVRFMDAKDCQKYYDETSNGVVYGRNTLGRELVCFVELGKDVDVVGGLLQAWFDNGVTRCVRAVGVHEDFGLRALWRMGEAKNRKLEGLEDRKTPGGIRSVVWRFCKIDEAVTFKAALHRDEEWEHCNIHYATDPCATATGIHLD